MKNQIDLNYLEEITGGDTELIVEMLSIFINDTPDQIISLEENAKEQKWKSVGTEAHRLKPTFLYVGLHELHDKARILEENSKAQKNLETVFSLIDGLKKGFEAVEESLKLKRDELKASL